MTVPLDCTQRSCPRLSFVAENWLQTRTLWATNNKRSCGRSKHCVIVSEPISKHDSTKPSPLRNVSGWLDSSSKLRTKVLRLLRTGLKHRLEPGRIFCSPKYRSQKLNWRFAGRSLLLRPRGKSWLQLPGYRTCLRLNLWVR